MSELMASMEKMMKGAPGGVEGMQKMMREVMQGKGDPSAAKAMPSVDDLPSHYALVDDFLDAIMQHEASASSIPTTKTGVPALEALALVLAGSKEARVYLRAGPKRGLRYLAARLCGGGVATVHADVGAVEVRPDGGGFDLDDAAGTVNDSAAAAKAAADTPMEPLAEKDPDPARTLAVLVAAVAGERRSKQVLIDQGCLEAAAQFLHTAPGDCRPVKNTAVEPGGVDGAGAARAMMVSTMLSEETASGKDPVVGDLCKDLALVIDLTHPIQPPSFASPPSSSYSSSSADAWDARRAALAVRFAAARLLGECGDDEHDVGTSVALSVSKNRTALAGLVHLLPRRGDGDEAGEAGEGGQHPSVRLAGLRCFGVAAALLRDMMHGERSRDAVGRRGCAAGSAAVGAGQRVSHQDLSLLQR